MMFLLDLAYGVEVLALGMGFAFLVWATQSQGEGQALAKTSGYIIAVLALLGILCTTYYGLSYWFRGHFTEPMSSMLISSKPSADCPCTAKKAMEHMMPEMRQGRHMEGMPSHRSRQTSSPDNK